MNQQPFFSLNTPYTFTDAEIAEFEARMNAPAPVNRLAECENMFDVVVLAYESASEVERAEMHPFFKMFYEMANGINTVSVDDDEFESETPDTQKPRDIAIGAACNAGKITPIELTANHSIVNQ
jgi:hypothetical protein